MTMTVPMPLIENEAIDSFETPRKVDRFETPRKVDVDSLHVCYAGCQCSSVDCTPEQACFVPLASDPLSSGNPPGLETPEESTTKCTAMSKEAPRCDGNGRNASSLCWWTHSDVSLLCPVTQFPICMLPYPPFKLCVDSNTSWLLDGKSLALKFIVSGSVSVCGKALLPSDIVALDSFFQRCKLGPFQPGRLAALQNDVAEAVDPEEKARKVEEMKLFQAAARTELKKIRRIQLNRLGGATKADKWHRQQTAFRHQSKHGHDGFDATPWPLAPGRIMSSSDLASCEYQYLCVNA